MKTILLVVVALAMRVGNVFAADQCATRQSFEEQAAHGEAKAQYWLGFQLEQGLCGAKDHQRANSLLQQSAAQNFPPAVHILGVLARRDGHDAQALEYFERAARLGFQIAIADVGFTYGLGDSPVLDPALSYAWLSLAISREPTEGPRGYLEGSRAKLMKAMSRSEKSRGKIVEAELQSQFSNIPVWSDK